MKLQQIKSESIANATAVQSPRQVFMIRPHHFLPNPQTASDNAYQTDSQDQDLDTLAAKAYDEVTQAAAVLRNNAIDVLLFDDTGTRTPDSVFPNNWISTHQDGHIGLYPMYCENRRPERRADIVDSLRQRFKVTKVVDFSGLEQSQCYLEGTGSMVLDYQHKRVYAVRSNRMHESALKEFCQTFDYQAVVFDAADSQGVDVYHTNVLMGVADDFAMIGLEMIQDDAQRAQVIQSLKQSGKEIIELTETQIQSYCGNTYELMTPNGPILVLSQTAFSALRPEQITQIEKYARLVPIDVSTIEMAGGSIRCMMTGIFLPPCA